MTWSHSSWWAKVSRRRTHRRNNVGYGLVSRLDIANRQLRIESIEPRLLLTHAAPMLNAADTATFTAISENISILSNTGETVGAIIASGGTITSSQPLGSNFAFFDTTNPGQNGNVGKEGIAVTGLTGMTDGVWEYSTNGGSSWSLAPNNLSYSNSLVLSGDSANNDKVRFLPNSNFAGVASMQFSAWDETDGKTPGSTENLTAPGATGGSTAYSTSGSEATLDVTASSVPPTFTLNPTTTLENNTVTGSGGSPGGSNPNLITVPNFASNIQLGSGGATSVSFAVTNPSSNFSTLFAQSPAIDSQGTLTYKLNPDVSGTATFNVTATNGSLVSSPAPSTITVTQINDPPTINAIVNPAPVLDTAGQQTIAISGITPGLNESSPGLNDSVQSVTVTAQATVQGGDIASLLSNISVSYSNGSGTIYYTPVVGQNGTLHITVTVQDNGGTLNGGVNTTTETFLVTVRTQPSFTPSNVRVLQNNVEPIPNWATNINPGYPGASGTFAITSDSFLGLFSASPSISPNGTLSFTPTSGGIGTATLTATYSSTVNGQVATSNSQTFTIFVAAPPTAKAETYEVNYTGSSSAGSTVGLLNNDTDPNWGATMLTPQIIVGSGPSNGSLSPVGADGSFTYTAGIGFQGLDRFSYQAVDSPASSNIVTDTIYSHEGALVNKLYQEALDRLADDTAITSHAPQLHSGSLNMYTLAGNVVASTEGKSVAVNRIFQQFLGRGASASDESYWDPSWVNGPDTVITGVASTAESYNYAGSQYGGASNTAWVTLLYWKLLNRAPDSGGLNYFVGQLNGGASRQTVVGEFLATDEHHAVVVNFYYQLYLGRSPSSSDSSYWVSQFDAGMTELSFQQDLVGTSEYATIPPALTGSSVDRLTS